MELFILTSLISILILILLSVIILLFKRSKNNSTDYMYENRKYTIIDRYRNKEYAIYYLNTINNNAIKLNKYIKNKFYNYTSDNYNNDLLQEIIYNLLNKYNPDDLEELDPIWSIGHKAVTNNFSSVSMCLRKKNGDFYDINLLMFVFLHELAHVGTPSRYNKKSTHPPEFWATFKFLIRNAKKINIINPIDYSKHKDEYCGIPIVYNPYFDDTIDF